MTGSGRVAARHPRPRRPATEPEDRLAPYVDLMLGSLSVNPVRNTRLVEIRFTSTDPLFAADMANALAKAYIQQSMEFSFTASKDAADWLSARLAEQRKTVEESEAALQAYKEKNGAVAVEDRQNIVVQRLTDLNAALTQARRPSGSTRKRSTTSLKAAEGTPGARQPSRRCCRTTTSRS